MKKKVIIALSACLTLLAAGCHPNGDNNTQTKPQTVDYSKVEIPPFVADSAYYYVEQQLAFGFRHPGAAGHAKCAQWIASTMRQWCDTVILQPFSTTLWDGSHADGMNIIASLAPERDNRILLAAHWDSRRWADQDLDTTKWHTPLPGANDGASGVGLLMEMARVMSAMPPDVGVDFVFFDVEDQGFPEWGEIDRYQDNTWCKGSQHWAQNPHRMFYRANYGILFDMVGTANPRFTKEEISMNFAQGIMNKMWNCAAQLGYGTVFVDELSSSILDDHLYVNQILHVPTIDVVQNSPDCSFYTHWHTVKDDLDAVDKSTLNIVATVAMKTLYGDYPHKK